MALSTQNGISIAEIIIYAPLLLGGIFLSIRHGFGRNAGWLYLIIFSLARILGAALELATISDPTNINLYVGSVTLQNIGLSPLLLLLLGLVGRALATSDKATWLGSPRHLRLVQVVIIVGLILGVVGGTQNSSSYSAGSAVEPNSLSKVGLGLMIAGFVLLSLVTALAGLKADSIAAGERRLVAVVAASMPLVLVRLIYSCVGTLANNKDFRPVIGNPYIQIGLSVVEEMIVVIMCEAVGVTLRKVPKGAPAAVDTYGMDGRSAGRVRGWKNGSGYASQSDGRV